RLESSRLRSFKISEIERGLYMGNYESANDVLLLESKRITHILTIDSVPLPRRILCILPKVVNLHLRVSDLPEEDILAHIAQIQEFISVKEDSSGTYNVLVHCYRGKSRSAAAVISYLMAKYSLPMEVGLSRVKRQRRLVNPNQSFLSQLKLFENMNWSIQRSNLQFRMFKLVMVSEKMRKAKILFRDSLNSILDPLLMGGDALPSVIYKCKSCRITLASSLHLLPHLVDESPSWTDSSWSAHSQDELASSFLYRSCSASVFINPIKWMEADIKNKLCGSLKCPNCRIVVGGFSWIKGESCYSCKAVIRPAFRLDITEIIFRTKCKFLQSSNREPILV
ncbi:Dual specificity protein phosphatase 12, partial [Caligus rogercresseyi]